MESKDSSGKTGKSPIPESEKPDANGEIEIDGQLELDSPLEATLLAMAMKDSTFTQFLEYLGVWSAKLTQLVTASNYNCVYEALMDDYITDHEFPNLEAFTDFVKDYHDKHSKPTTQ